MGMSSGSSSSTPKDMTPEAFQNLQQPLADLLGNSLRKYGRGSARAIFQGYKGPKTAAITDTETQALADLNQAVQQDAPGAQNPYLDAAVAAGQRETQQTLEETLGRTLPGRFAMAGQQTQPKSSSAFDRAAAIATRGGADALGDISTNMRYAAFNEAQGRQVDNMVKNLQAQALPRLIKDMGIERGTEAFNQRVNSILSAMGVTAGVTRPVIASESESSQSGFNLK